MRVGVISDTHNPSVGDEPPPEVVSAFDGVDVIIHAGDIYQPSCLDWPEKIAPVYAVELGVDAHFKEDARVVAMARVLDLSLSKDHLSAQSWFDGAHHERFGVPMIGVGIRNLHHPLILSSDNS
jgi:hypothetical protein